jgi:hypothetical protein
MSNTTIATDESRIYEGIRERKRSYEQWLVDASTKTVQYNAPAQQYPKVATAQSGPPNTLSCSGSQSRSSLDTYCQTYHT